MKFRNQVAASMVVALMPFAATFAADAPNAAAKLTATPAQKCKNTVDVLNARSARLETTKAAAMKHYKDAKTVWIGRVSNATTYSTKGGSKVHTKQYREDLAVYNEQVAAFGKEYDDQIALFKGMQVDCTTAHRAALNKAITDARNGRAELVKDQAAIHSTAVDKVIPDVKNILTELHAIKASKGYKRVPVPTETGGGEG